jgi:hypothetical protein
MTKISTQKRLDSWCPFLVRVGAKGGKARLQYSGIPVEYERSISGIRAEYSGVQAEYEWSTGVPESRSPPPPCTGDTPWNLCSEKNVKQALKNSIFQAKDDGNDRKFWRRVMFETKNHSVSGRLDFRLSSHAFISISTFLRGEGA